MTESKAHGKKPVKKGTKAKARKPKDNVNVYSLDGKVKDTIALPQPFHEAYRPDLIRRAVVAARANRRQPYAPSPTAGMRHAVYWPGKGRGMARTPRTRGGSGEGAEAPNTRGGRRAHPPRVETDRSKAMNRKERKKARNSALNAITHHDLVQARGHRFDEKLTLPVVVEDAFTDTKSTKEAIEVLKNLGLYDDIVRAKDGVHIRAGRGKMRGRRYRQPKSILVVVNEPEKVKSFKNLPGVDVVSSKNINTEHLAPGGDPGRLSLFTESALRELETWGKGTSEGRGAA